MSKWADYLVSEVRYNTENTRIEKLRCCEQVGGVPGAIIEVTRRQVVSSIKARIYFYTMLKDKNGQTTKETEIKVMKIGRSEFLKTSADGIEQDNLQSLPRF